MFTNKASKPFFRIGAAQLLLIAWLMPAVASAGLIDPGDFGATHNMSQGDKPAFLSYDGSTDVFTAQATWPDALLKEGGTRIADDIDGVFSLEAIFDENGVFSGGSFSVVASSVTLGILDPTVLISGSLVLGEYVDTTWLQFVAIKTFLDPTFGTFVGDINSILMTIVANPCGMFDLDPWECDYTNWATPTSAPDMHLSPLTYAVPEPHSLAILGAGLLALIGARLQRRRA